MNLSPGFARAIAFLVAAVIFVGGMLLVATFVAAPFSHWVGEQTRGWGVWGHLALIACLVIVPLWLSRLLRRRDQRKADRATL